MSEVLEAPLLTIGEAARQLHLSPSAVRRRIWSGELQAVRLGSGSCPPVRIEPLELERFIRASTRLDRTFRRSPAGSAGQAVGAVEGQAHRGDVNDRSEGD